MADDNKPKLEFFGDIRDKLFLILAGIISLTTVIPAFLNSIADIFGWPIYAAYYVFVAIYFIIPYVFYSVYCSIHNDVGYLEIFPSGSDTPQLFKKIIEAFILILAYAYLLWDWDICTYVFTILIYDIGIVFFIFFSFLYRTQREVYKEYRVIGWIVIGLFGLFFVSNTQKINKKYNYKNRDAAFKAYELKDEIKKNLTNLSDSARSTAYKYRMQAAVTDPALEDNNYKPDGCKECNIEAVYKDVGITAQRIDAASKNSSVVVFDTAKTHVNISSILKADIGRMLKYDSTLVKDHSKNLYQVEEIYKACVYLDEYTNAISRSANGWINTRWAALLSTLQFKSLAWLQFLILLGLCLWLKLQVRLKMLNNMRLYRASVISDDINQVKNFIILLFVLIVPWFRKIDSTTVNTEKPFLNISLIGLASGKYIPDNPAQPPAPLPGTDTDKNKPVNMTFISRNSVLVHDTLVLNCDTPGKPGKKDTSVLHAIHKTQDLIIEGAKRTIANPADRDIRGVLKNN